ncbi:MULTISPECIES: GNAT family N-acetyltransferase [unclassified Breznakia]|uniref:GNAT family N-acetyltransferase n=1 Tax=unclassified Breznakia TaxID=2623764 RepID=UPI002474EA41|nr:MULTISPECIES: GNAT family N-acetyltransferase [unclassified Breznakia]MDH6366671.1 GNAT superfamily N-acetyltransferase [Breznakia sp. PH1-1]MDH6403764.1 GNAT superfamily N-acetyltransferase [Breznakia sp. PF1-11]MDH6411473.1 GNAT superfamily N-acetyltransferase [Breznakia sp. PFB1-11]MDH6413796.1 GNAT superfamily N-acetyltransferase [Breznakia sp. PFB1-14]MDH6416226.1 GNAT superfamily N-acetyltransferase [Breznakia sp. PFB1-4]
MEIKKIDAVQIPNAIDLIWETFLQFEGPDYSKEGIQWFKDYIDNKEIMTSVEFWGAYNQDELQGVIATRNNRKHICFFFVKAKYHKQGIGRKLWEYIRDESKSEVITVNASPYAISIYHKLGFVDVADEQVTNGIRFTPMKYEF